VVVAEQSREQGVQLIGERPRELKWYHAAGMLFGDWGTSRLYVLGIAFVLSGHASFWYVAAMCLLVTVVGFAYTIICAHFPDGGGVYSAAKRRSRHLAVVGALLLIADYVITAALSAYAGFRYILPSNLDSRYALYASIAAIVVIGVINRFGPRRAGMLAVVVGAICAIFYLLIGISCLPTLPEARIVLPQESAGDQWRHFVNVILALSGIEAIANMTGVLAEPVTRNARRAIFVVLLEVVVLNLVMAAAMNAIPALDQVNLASLTPHQREDLQDHMVKVLAENQLGSIFSQVASFFFGLLLLSAANTAIGSMVAIQYLMGRDRELPRPFTSLNGYGVPWLGVLTGTAAPIIVLLVVITDYLGARLRARII
jgi:amino acid transporter